MFPAGLVRGNRCMSSNVTIDLPIRPAHVETARTSPHHEWGAERVRPLSPALGHVAHALRDLSVTSWMALDTLLLCAGMTLGYRLFAMHPALPSAHLLCWQAVAIGCGALAVATARRLIVAYIAT